MPKMVPDGEGICFVVYPGLTLLDLVGPLEVLTDVGESNPAYRAYTVGKVVEPADTDMPLRIIPDKTFDEVPRPYGVIVPGGSGAIRAMGDETLQSYLKSTARTARFVGSVCTGALVLAAADLLQARNATTHWRWYKFLERLGAKYVRKRWVEDGKFVTAAGVSAGIDMAIFLAARLTDEKTARRIQLGIEYDPQPPFGGIDWTSVDQDAFVPSLEDRLREVLADRPSLLRRLLG